MEIPPPRSLCPLQCRPRTPIRISIHLTYSAPSPGEHGSGDPSLAPGPVNLILPNTPPTPSPGSTEITVCMDRLRGGCSAQNASVGVGRLATPPWIVLYVTVSSRELVGFGFVSRRELE